MLGSPLTTELLLKRDMYRASSYDRNSVSLAIGRHTEERCGR